MSVRFTLCGIILGNIILARADALNLISCHYCIIISNRCRRLHCITNQIVESTQSISGRRTLNKNCHKLTPTM